MRTAEGGQQHRGTYAASENDTAGSHTSSLNITTGGPLNNGHIGTSKFVHCREVVHSQR